MVGREYLLISQETQTKAGITGGISRNFLILFLWQETSRQAPFPSVDVIPSSGGRHRTTLSYSVLLTWYSPGFFNLSPTDILVQRILCHGGRPVNCRMFSSMLCLYLLDANSKFHPLPPLPKCDKSVSRHCQMLPGVNPSPYLRTNGLKCLSCRM